MYIGKFPETSCNGPHFRSSKPVGILSEADFIFRQFTWLKNRYLDHRRDNSNY
jgi:hypothetical protein